MITPVIDKYVLEIGSEFYNTDFIKKYDNFLFHKNYPIKDLQNHIHANFDNITVPGLTIVGNNVNNLSNNVGGSITKPMSETSVNRQYSGTQPLDELFNSKNITITNTSTILNWMYFYEYFRNYYSRERTVKDFKVFMTVMDQSDLPLMQFIFSDCFINTLPDLTFEASMISKEKRTFDLGITFNKFDTKLIIPEFEVKEINLKK